MLDRLKDCFYLEGIHLLSSYLGKNKIYKFEFFNIPWEDNSLFVTCKEGSFGFILRENFIDFKVCNFGVVETHNFKGVRDLKRLLRGIDMGRWLVYTKDMVSPE